MMQSEQANEDFKRAAIYIPAYNAASTLPLVIERIPHSVRKNVAEIFIVDNHSSDNTSLVAVGIRDDENMHNLEIIRNAKNEGYGGSQKIAYQRAIEKNFACIAMLHGDAQYAPELVGELMKPVLNGETDMIFGSRMSGHPLRGGMPLHRFLGNRLLTWVQNKLLHTNLSEFHSGYRVYSVEALKKVPFERLSSDYHFDTEIIILFIEHSLRIKESAIPTHYGEEKNYVNIWKYGMDVLVTTGSYFLHRAGLRKSRKWTKILQG